MRIRLRRVLAILGLFAALWFAVPGSANAGATLVRDKSGCQGNIQLWNIVWYFTGYPYNA